MKQAKHLILTTLLMASLSGFAQKEYQFSVDLTQPKDDKLTVNLDTPPIREKNAVYHLPKVVPGTYSINNYGSYASDFKAFDKKGRALKVNKLDKNSWKISKAKKLARISYQIDDTWDTPEITEDVFEPSGTNIEENRIFVLNSFGLFGYFKGMEKLPYRVNITKPEGFYGSTSLVNQNKTGNKDLFVTNDYHELADAPMMYNRPDTVWLKVGNADILVSVFSPNNKFATKDLAADIKPTLEAQKDYLGGTLPIDKYAFIIYMSDRQDLTRYGALEHAQSSFYYLPESFLEGATVQIHQGYRRARVFSYPHPTQHPQRGDRRLRLHQSQNVAPPVAVRRTDRVRCPPRAAAGRDHRPAYLPGSANG